MDRLILYEDLPENELPLNPHGELWIEIRPDDPTLGEYWALRQIVAQCDTGEVKVVDRYGNNEQIIDLTKKAYHWVRPPRKSVSVAPSTSPPENDPDEDVSTANDSLILEPGEVPL